jgi:hypothetical protein
MNTLKKSATQLMIVALFVLLAGCEDTTVSPCLDCAGAGERVTEVSEHTFVVGDQADITVRNFAGKVTYRQGEAGKVYVKAIRRAALRSSLDRIDLVMTAASGGLEIRSENPDRLPSVSVDLEITGPASARPQLHNAAGPIDYRGRPKGACSFVASAGSVTLGLPADVSVTLDLTTVAGTISLGLPVDGSVESHAVRGRIGSGDEGEINASTAAGNIYLVIQ